MPYVNPAEISAVPFGLIVPESVADVVSMLVAVEDAATVGGVVTTAFPPEWGFSAAKAAVELEAKISATAMGNTASTRKRLLMTGDIFLPFVISGPLPRRVG